VHRTPLGVEPVLHVDTHSPVDGAALAADVRAIERDGGPGATWPTTGRRRRARTSLTIAEHDRRRPTPGKLHERMGSEMTTDTFADVAALSFDCYGTLIDWETGITHALRPWLERHDLAVERDDVLAAFSANETMVQSETPGARYPRVLAEVMRRIGRRLGAPVSDDEAEAFGRSVGDWPAFPDSADALSRLSTRFSLIILSNVDRASFARSNERLGVTFDRIVTAEDVGSYKPTPANFTALLAAVEELGLGRHQLVHVAESLYHDHQPAKVAGLRTAWIHRRHAQDGFGATPEPLGDVTPDWRFTSMAALADAAGV
jgi:2-haloacid dehalogenase